MNLGQSSNDVIPTAIQLVGRDGDRGRADPRARPAAARRSRPRASEFWPIVKTGRTHLQDATPIRLGQEFKGYAGQIEESIRRARGAIDELARIPLGGTAVGTGLNSHPQYARIAAARLAKATGLPVRRDAESLPRAGDARRAWSPRTARCARSPPASGRSAPTSGSWAPGPIAGLGELRLPETQPGSSIMPGKVNPVIIESLTDGDRARLRQRPDRGRSAGSRAASSS